jgi:quercetin dioxygenase-like cupin family protein
MPGVVEHDVISSGRALVGVTGDEPVEQHPGDYVGYPGDVAHLFRALEPDALAVPVSEHT